VRREKPEYYKMCLQNLEEPDDEPAPCDHGHFFDVSFPFRPECVILIRELIAKLSAGIPVEGLRDAARCRTYTWFGSFL
jgi:hypothetical protein